ncbi:I78 family peptidase inhibitor [Hasllibacter sp. MH4015]|uniref:I78 family peptidase inhibitor n=1 Tax=Hasllibacter sp. MH4015 TaxID=2854029 RepID=UPI001CD5E1EF|nr:I78 family peptidase inhibitor [Hasllibacter sp. MH4015]
MTRFAYLPVLFVIAACQPIEPGFGPGFDDPNACGAEAVQGLVGQPLAAASGVAAPGGVRRIGPGDVVTTDYNPMRMNISHDGATITRISCG